MVRSRRNTLVQFAAALNKGFLSIYERCNLHPFFGLNDSNDKPNQASENKITLSNTLGHLGLPKVHHSWQF